MRNVLGELVELLSLERLEQNLFRGQSQDLGWGNVFGGQVLEFEVGGIRSGKESAGHRFLSPGAFEVTGWDDYLEKMRGAMVIADPEERRSSIARQIGEAARSEGGEVSEDEELLDTTVKDLGYRRKGSRIVAAIESAIERTRPAAPPTGLAPPTPPDRPESATATRPLSGRLSPPAAPGSTAGWFPDPTGRFDHRYWDGERWTEHAGRGGKTITDHI